MIKIVTCNIYKDYNLGGPSILYGIDELMKYLYGDDYEILNFENRYIPEPRENTIPMKTVHHSLIRKRNPFAFLLGNEHMIGIPAILKEIKQADVIIDLYGISFCDNLVSRNPVRILYPLHFFNSAAIPYLAKKFCHKKVIKNTASYGPINNEFNKISAEYFGNNIYDVMVAREEKSRQVLHNLGTIKKEVLLAPDIANLMPYDTDIKVNENKVCISVSHQIKRQWAAQEDYISCIANLCKHIAKEGREIVLVPNECQPGTYNDISVAYEVQKALKDTQVKLSIMSVEKMTAVEIKNEIAASGALIASRYHSCVAGLSAGVPTLVIGWHYKYDELLEKYGQERWILSNHDCDSQKLLAKYDEFMAHRQENLQIIAIRKDIVRQKVFEVGRQMMERAGVL